MHRVRTVVDIAATPHIIVCDRWLRSSLHRGAARSMWKLVTSAWRGEAARTHCERAVHVFSLGRVVGDLAHVHSTQGMTGAAEINLSMMTSYAAASKAATSGDDNA